MVARQEVLQGMADLLNDECLTREQVVERLQRELVMLRRLRDKDWINFPMLKPDLEKVIRLVKVIKIGIEHIDEFLPELEEKGYVKTHQNPMLAC